MNTGLPIETERLKLIPGNNARDDEPFISMLRNDGNFRDFCGLKFSEKYLSGFRNYFEREDDSCYFSIYPKNTDAFVGYVGFHCEAPSYDYEIEFYISKSERRKGYCEEACKAAINFFFNESLSVNNHYVSKKELYATVLPDNKPAISLLSKLGFERHIPDDGPVVIAEGFIDEEGDEFHGYCISKYILKYYGRMAEGTCEIKSC